MWKPDCKPVVVLAGLRSLCSQTTAVAGLKFVMAACGQAEELGTGRLGVGNRLDARPICGVTDG